MSLVGAPAYPIIESIGPPPERHAERIAAEMTKWLIAEHHRREDGNPSSQARLVRKLRDAAGPTLFSAALIPGKRRKYELYLHRYVGWEHGDIILPGCPIPEKPWIACLLQRILSTHAKVQTDQLVVALISHHALSRICERGNARTPADLLDHAKSLSLAVVRAKIDPDAAPAAGWRIPYEGGVAIVRLDDESRLPLIATVLPP